MNRSWRVFASMDSSVEAGLVRVSSSSRQYGINFLDGLAVMYHQPVPAMDWTDGQYASRRRRSKLRSTAFLLVGCLAAWLTVPVRQGIPATSLASADFLATVFAISQASPATALPDGDEAQRLLRMARQAMSQKDFALAETYIERAERLNVRHDPLHERFLDSPAKARQSLRELQAANPASGPGAGSAPLPTLDGDAKSLARSYLERALAALRQGDLAGAVTWRQRAMGTGARFEPGELSPDSLAAELRKAGVSEELLAARGGSATATAEARPDDFREATQASPLLPVPSETNQRNSAFQSALVRDPNQLAAPRDPLPTISGPRPGASSPPGQYGYITDSPNPVAPRRLPNSPADARKQEALRLMAMSRASMDRGDLQNALTLAEQARAIDVPDQMYQANDSRPELLLMEIQSAMTRRGMVPSPTSTAVNQAYHAGDPAGQPYPVTTGVYRPNEDPSHTTTAQALTPPLSGEGTPEPTTGNSGSAMELYEKGLAALEQQRQAEALEFFSQAWQYEAEFDSATRQALRDKLTLLRVATPRDPAPSENPLEQIDSQQQLLRQQLGREVFQELSASERTRTTDPRGSLTRLRNLRARIDQESLDPPTRRQILALVDRGIQESEQYIQQHLGDIELRERNQGVLEHVDRDRQEKLDRQDKLAELVEKFNDLMDEQRHAEAEVLAKQARELDPYSEVVRSMQMTSRFAGRVREQESIRAMKEAGMYDAMTSVEQSMVPFDDRNPLMFSDVKTWQQLSRTRGEWLREQSTRLTPAEQQIQESLKTQVDVRFQNQPLSEVVETLGRMAGVNVYLDAHGLSAEGVTTDEAISISLTEPISLRSALNLILEPLHLSYVIQNEVLRITSEQTRESDTYVRVYNVADLVIPIPNFMPSYNIGLPGALREAMNATGMVRQGASYEPVALTLAKDEVAPAAPSNASVLAQMSSSGMLPSPSSRSSMPSGLIPGGMGGATMADFDTLINLITTTIKPETWEAIGGPGSIEGFPTNLSLVISQTQEVHEQIADLLDQLRRLQDLQVTIEVRFITLNDRFFERIGIDFDFNIEDNSSQIAGQNPVIRDRNRSTSFGLDPTGAPTVDFDYQFRQNSFGSTLPQFGGFDASTAADFGFAILSDIEVFFLLQASQGDDRTNVLQAPKVTLFNGQMGFVNDTSQRPFVTSVIPVVGDFAAAHQPVVVVLSEGTSLSVQAVVSPDRRFVRLTLLPMFSSIGNVDTFTFTGSRTSDSGTNVADPSDEGSTVRDNQRDIISGTTVQLPTFNMTTVSTTVSVPDGGTVLLGGIKRLSEGRNERGVPMLSKLPYVNRLFRNVGIGRDTQSLMMMVTPRIIIQEEEELLQTGFEQP
jgi:general secretion pathway protein D